MQSALSAARVLDGIAIASEIKSEVARDVDAARLTGYTPGLAVILVGENPASQIYVRNKIKACGETGIRSEMHTPPASITTEALLALVHSLNERDDVDGILIQLPLPEHVDTSRLLEAVDPRKDVDGFHPINAGRLLSGAPMETVLAPCTPAGIMEILKRSHISIAGANAVVVGRSNIVGKPVAAMLINASATVTVCHSRTRDLPKITREADILVAAIGRAGYVHRDMVCPGATIVDVGINRLTGEAEFSRFFPPEHPDHLIRREGFDKRGSTVIGDVDPAAFAVAGAYTPVPGGVGALTIAMLMSNTVKAALLRRNLPAARH
jgi:methylenetetrahydrofolate dehydrogenase (NADP+) / methenyltetrahydrofolate cyclohydrolase